MRIHNKISKKHSQKDFATEFTRGFYKRIHRILQNPTRFHKRIHTHMPIMINTKYSRKENITQKTKQTKSAQISLIVLMSI